MYTQDEVPQPAVSTFQLMKKNIGAADLKMFN